MTSNRRAEIEAVRSVLSDVTATPDESTRAIHALLRRGAGEEEIVAHLRRTSMLHGERRVALARDLLRIGVRPTGAFRKRRTGPDVCTICEREVPFCWGCRCGFALCQSCLEENRWGITCNNITWECPDCGNMRSF